MISIVIELTTCRQLNMYVACIFAAYARCLMYFIYFLIFYFSILFTFEFNAIVVIITAAVDDDGKVEENIDLTANITHLAVVVTSWAHIYQ